MPVVLFVTSQIKSVFGFLPRKGTFLLKVFMSDISTAFHPKQLHFICIVTMWVLESPQ